MTNMEEIHLKNNSNLIIINKYIYFVLQEGKIEIIQRLFYLFSIAIGFYFQTESFEA